MNDQAFNALVATVLGTALAVVLVLPVAFRQYRRDGRLGPRDLALLLSGAVYGLALWTYTLLPMPAADDYRCVGRQTTPFDTIGAIDWGAAGSRAGLSALVHDPAFLQVALNVLLFVPFGFFVRRVLRRGVVVATLLGFATSLAIECTQTTGVWGLYPCAYRLLDVDDLVVNTLGATIGSLVAILLVRGRKGEVEWPTTVTLGRRLVGMGCDALFVLLLGTTLVIAFRAWELYGRDVPVGDLPADPQRWLQWVVPAVVEAAAVLLAGRTVGEWVVAVRARAGRVPAFLARPLKLATGVGPLLALGFTTATWAAPALLGFVLLTLAAAALTRDRRGLAHLLSGMRLEVVLPAAARRAAEAPGAPEDAPAAG